MFGQVELAQVPVFLAQYDFPGPFFKGRLEFFSPLEKTQIKHHVK